MHRDYTRSLPSVHSLSGFAGLEEYNHDTYITGSLADTHLFAGHGRPGHLPSGGAEYWREISSTSTGAAVGAALRAGVGIDSDEESARHCGATAFHRLPDPIWSHLAHHFRPHARTVTHLLAEMALSRGAVVCISQCTDWKVHLSTTTCTSAPGWWVVQSPTTSPAPACRRELPATTCPSAPGGCRKHFPTPCSPAPGCSLQLSRSSSEPGRSASPAAGTALRLFMWIRI